MNPADDNAPRTESQVLRASLEAVATTCAQQAKVSSLVKADAYRLIQIGDAFQRGIALFVLRRFDEADNAFEEATFDTNYYKFEPAFWRANSWFAARDYDRAFPLYQLCMDIEPTHVGVARMMANCLMRTQTGSLVDNHRSAQQLLLAAMQDCEPDTEDYAKLHDDLGDAYRMYDVARDQGWPADLDAARAAYYVAMKTYESLGDMRCWADVAVFASPVVAQCRPDNPVPQLQEALALLDRAIPHINRQLRPETWSNACQNRAACLARLYPRPRSLLERVERLYRRFFRHRDPHRTANG